MKILDKIFVILITTTLLNSCNTTEPTDDLEPGRRDYTWTVDTLDIPFTHLQRIWGSSPNDVWAIGPGGDADKTIYHFDGVKWRTDGISRPLAPTALFGFSPDNIWIGGRGGDIWNYNGSDWVKNTTVTIAGYDWISIENIWGDAPNNVYAVGFAENNETYKGVIFKYDGVKWESLETPEIRNSFIKIQRGLKTSNHFFVLGIRFEQFFDDTSYIYEFDGTKLSAIYSGFTNNTELGELQNINDEMFFLKGFEICKYINGNFLTVYKITNTNFGNGIWGRNEKDIFLRMTDGIAHYNGSDIEYLYHFSTSVSLNGAAVFNDEVFFLAYDFNTSLNLIIRGKFK